MAEKFTRWDAADYLEGEEDAALNDIARARGITQLARDTGLTREGLYRALSVEGNPEFATVFKVIRALKIKLHAASVSPPRAKRATRRKTADMVSA